MRPIKLTMQGFGSYGSDEQVIDFTEPEHNIFLITGNTGSGKSTIFDAIVFALYGESSSEAKNKKGSELQSQFSSFDVTPFVELVFSEREGGRENVYTVRRTPMHTRLKERGSGTTKGDAEACLTLPDGQVIDRPINRVDNKLVEIVKLDKSQFKKVAMLAQGEFMAMLSASSKEKKQIFRGIFDTEIYGDIANVLVRRRGALKQKLDSKFAAFRASVGQVIVEPGHKAADELRILVDSVVSSDELDVVYAEDLINALSRFNEEVKSELDLSNKEQQERAALYKKAVEALQNGKALQNSFEQLEKAEADLSRCRAEETAVAAKAELVERIDAAFDIANANALYAQASENCRRDNEKLEKLQDSLPAMYEEAEKASERVEHAQKAQMEAAENADALVKAIERAMDALRSVGKAQRSVVERQAVFAAAKADYAKARTSFENANSAFLDSQAGYIAKELVPGKPCPVCGSIDHPAPHEPLFSESMNAITLDGLDELKDAYDKASEAQASASAEAGHAIEGLNATYEELRESADALEEGFAAQTSSLLALVKPLIDATSNKRTLDDIERIFKKAKPAADSAIDAARKIAEDSASVLRAAQQSANEARTRLEVDQRSANSIRDSLPQMEARKAELGAALDALVKEKGEAGIDWENTVKEHFKGEIKQLREEIGFFNDLRSRAQGTKTAAIEAIGSAAVPDIDKLSSAADAAKAKMDEAYKKSTELAAIYEADSRVSDAIAAEFSEWQSASCEFETADELCRRLSGTKSGERMDLETYVQRYYFRQILQDANRRLLEMTNNEYEFRMVDRESAGAGSNKGLDLMVYSATNDAVRDIKTLSGGESFMAALAFALGLSDQIMAKKSAVNLDIMFIDEGFGSLDDNARKQAVDTLRSMTGDGRMIGIISHVAELKQAIDDQLVVTKDSSGSHAQWHMN